MYSSQTHLLVFGIHFLTGYKVDNEVAQEKIVREADNTYTAELTADGQVCMERDAAQISSIQSADISVALSGLKFSDGDEQSFEQSAEIEVHIFLLATFPWYLTAFPLFLLTHPLFGRSR